MLNPEMNNAIGINIHELLTKTYNRFNSKTFEESNYFMKDHMVRKFKLNNARTVELYFRIEDQIRVINKQSNIFEFIVTIGSWIGTLAAIWKVYTKILYSRY